ncbi:unnamed protein product [Caenorhabditis bovis]|uniref:ShKT domain-containing protein n=1 Tax=Caenorhabditis bovis TaxID=2654633 RepID=A0A8S1FF13_9PELO|nr:unnamed protein product [Caenorhabditis bovis]
MHLLVKILLILGSTSVTAELREKPKFQVIRAVAENLQQLNALRDIHLNTQHELDFWLTPSKVGHRADIMVDDEKFEFLSDVLQRNNVSYNIIIDDVEKLIIDKEHKPKKLHLFGKRLNNEGGNRARYGFGEYHSYATIVDYMRDIERKYPNRARVFSIGKTVEGRDIYAIKIGQNIVQNKRIFWIDGGIHAREWAAVHTVVWFIDRVNDPIIREALSKMNFIVVPVANPDGYEYTRSDVSPMVRLWRKNRAGVVCKKDRWFRDRCCGGVDLNRNFDWYFGEVGSSTDKCSEIYQGAFVFSENESRAIANFFKTPEVKDKVDGFITVHTYSQMWIHPYSHQRKTVPNDIRDLERVGRAAVSALENTFGTKYRFGTGSDILYPSSGGSDDWAKGKAGVKYVYLIELRPGEDVWDGFILDQHQLIPTAKETWNGVKVVIKAVSDMQRTDPDSSFVSSMPPPITTTTTSTTTTTTSTTTTTTTIAPTTQFVTPTEPNILEFMFTNAPIATTSPPIHLDASYKLGKRRFKFVSIKTFMLATPAWLLATSTMAPTPPPSPLIAPSSSANSLIDFVGRPPVAAFVRRPASSTIKRLRPGFRRPSGSSPHVMPAFRSRTSSAVSLSSSVPQSTQLRTSSQSGRCADRSAWCSAWLNSNRNVCQISSIYMRRDCARTCGFCR